MTGPKRGDWSKEILDSIQENTKARREGRKYCAEAQAKPSQAKPILRARDWIILGILVVVAFILVFGFKLGI